MRCALLLGGLAIGCGSGQDSMEKRLEELQREVVTLQNSQDRFEERLAAVQLGQRQRARSEAERSERSTMSRPPLKVVPMRPGQQSRPSPKQEAADDQLEGEPGSSPDDPSSSDNPSPASVPDSAGDPGEPGTSGSDEGGPEPTDGEASPRPVLRLHGDGVSSRHLDRAGRRSSVQGAVASCLDRSA